MTALTEQLKATKNEMTGLVNAIKQEDIDRIPFEDSWTAGQLLEHVDKAVSPSILTGNTVAVTRAADEKVAGFKNIFLDFTTKFKSPEFIEPTETVHDKDVLLDSLATKFDELINAAETMNLQEECIDFEVPGMGKFTRLEWIAFYDVHTKRHMHQLKNIVTALQ